MKEVQVILGHSSYATTADIYSHVDLSGKTRAGNYRLEQYIKTFRLIFYIFFLHMVNKWDY